MASSTKHVYWLCDSYTDKKDGKRIETGVNMDTCKDFDSFLKQLYKRGEITEEEFNKFTTAYYDWA